MRQKTFKDGNVQLEHVSKTVENKLQSGVYGQTTLAEPMLEGCCGVVLLSPTGLTAARQQKWKVAARVNVLTLTKSNITYKIYSSKVWNCAVKCWSRIGAVVSTPT